VRVEVRVWDGRHWMTGSPDVAAAAARREP
jgi:hypothetical protein